MDEPIMKYPILENDLDDEAFIEPSKVIARRDVPEHCVICFFRDIIEKVSSEHHAKIAAQNSWEDGPHPIYEMEYKARRLAYYHPGIGSAQSVGLLEEAIAFGCRKFIACGGCGVLDKQIGLGHLICVEAAVRDEGASYHYLSPGREAKSNAAVLQSIKKVLADKGIPHVVAKTWSTDAPYRETRSRIARRKSEGCVVVDMEAAGMIAVAGYRKVSFGHIMYGGDDLSGSEWDNRDWQMQSQVRENLFWLSAEAVFSL
jgi:uridine phosphorylase